MIPLYMCENQQFANNLHNFQSERTYLFAVPAISCIYEKTAFCKEKKTRNKILV